MNKKKRLVAILWSVLILIVAVLIFIWVKYGGRAQTYECTNYAMGTYIQQIVYGDKAVDAATAAAKSIGELEDLISWRVDTSDVASLNAEAGVDWIPVDTKTVSLLQTALDVAEKSDGAFNPMLLPITSLWDFGGDNQHVPDAEQIQKFLPFTSYENLRVNTATSSASIKIHSASIDLGGIGKGAACDEGIAAYQEAGATAGIISVGGSVGVFGAKPGSSDWSIAVRDPNSTDENVQAMGVLSLKSGFISTSGVYEKQFTENGVTYHHLLDPATGYPVDNGLVSVTVVCGNGAVSDALSTACFVLGTEKGIALLEQYGAEGIFIDENNRVTVTEGLKNQFTLSSGQYTLS